MNAWGLSWSDAWADSWGGEEVQPIEQPAPAPAAITPPVDFVISSPYYMGARIQIYRNAKVEKKPDDRELLEMMRMYTAATAS